MKNLLFSTPLALLICACSSGEKAGDSGMSIAPETVYVEKTDTVPADEPASETDLSDSELKALANKIFWAMPDHGDYSSDTRGYMTREFYEATVQGFDAPGDYPGGIGSEEDLYYWYMGNDEACLGDIKDITIKSRTTDKAQVVVKFKDACEGYKNYPMTLVKEEGHWKAADFNGMLSHFKKFNADMRKAYSGNGATRLCIEAGLDPDEDTATEFLRQVNNYKKKYGIK